MCACKIRKCLEGFSGNGDIYTELGSEMHTFLQCDSHLNMGTKLKSCFLPAP